MTLEQTIKADLAELPDNLKQDVANYVAFLKSRYVSESGQTTTNKVFGKSKAKDKLADDSN